MSGKGAIIANARGVAQLGRARGSGLRGRRFKSCRPDLQQDISNYAGVLIFCAKWRFCVVFQPAEKFFTASLPFLFSFYGFSFPRSFYKTSLIFLPSLPSFRLFKIERKTLLHPEVHLMVTFVI